MQSLMELLHTCVGVFGCGCLDEEFWLSTRRRPASLHDAPPLLHPRPQPFRPPEDLLENLLRTPPPEPSLEGLGEAPGGSSGSTGQLYRGTSSSSEEMYRAGSFNTKVAVLRSASPFYKLQEQSEAPASSQQQQQQHAAAPAGAFAAAAEGIELKPAAANVLLGQQHYESRGKFVAAHPVARPAGTPQKHRHHHHHQPGGAVRRSVSPIGQQPVAAASDS